MIRLTPHIALVGGGTLTGFGLTGDFAAARDLELLAEAIGASMAELVCDAQARA